jgi:hypothetical protein
MKLPVVLAVLTGIFLLACSSDASAPANPTSHSGATGSTSKSDDELEIYFKQTVTTNE